MRLSCCIKMEYVVSCVSYVSRYCCPVVLILYASIHVGEELNSRVCDSCVVCFPSLSFLVSARGMDDPTSRC
jgi:hypothetical protein